MKTKITVTAEDIANGTPLEADCCAVALALERKFKALASVGDTLHIQGVCDIPIPKCVARFIDKFDALEHNRSARLKLKPFSFMIDVKDK